MRTYCLAIAFLSVTLAAQPSSKFKQVDSYITNGVRSASMFDFQPRIPSTVAERTLTASVGATLTFTSSMGGCPWGVNGANTSHGLYISGGTGTAETVTITGGTCTAGATSGTITFTPANNHSGQWTIRSATGGLREALQDLPSAGGTVWANGGSITIRSNPLGGITKPFTLLMGAGTYTTDVPFAATTTGQRIVGLGTTATKLVPSATFTVNAVRTLSGCTNATPIVCTSTVAHGYSVNDVVHVYGETGNTAANGSWYVSVVGSTTTFTLQGSVGNAADTGGGSSIKINPMISFINNTAPIFGGEASGIEITCMVGGSGAVVAGCAGVVGQGLENESLLSNLYINHTTSAIVLTNSTTQASTAVTVEGIDAIALAAGAVGYTFQAVDTRGSTLVCNSSPNTVQGIACVHVRGSTALYSVTSEGHTDAILQDPSTFLAVDQVLGLNHVAPAGSTTNVLHTRSGDVAARMITASADGGSSTPSGVLDDAKTKTIAGSAAFYFTSSSGNVISSSSENYFYKSDGAPILLRSGNANNYAYLDFGRATSDGLIGTVGSGNQWTTGSVQGDIVARMGAARAFWFDTNAGTGTAALKIKATNAGIQAVTYDTATNCGDNAGAAACGSAAAGSVVIDAAATTVVVSTTAVTANSQIILTEDPSAAARHAITCNTVAGRTYAVTARVAATSFTITASAAPAVTPACLNYLIIN